MDARVSLFGVVELLDNEGNTVSFHTRLLRHFVEFHGHTYNCHPDAVDLANGACDLCSDCVRVDRPTLGHAQVRIVQTHHLLSGEAVQVGSLNAAWSKHALATRPAIVFRVLHCACGGSLQVASLRSCP